MPHPARTDPIKPSRRFLANAAQVVVPDVWQVSDPATGQVPGDAVVGHDVLVWFQTSSPTRLWPLADPPITSAP